MKEKGLTRIETGYLPKSLNVVLTMHRIAQRRYLRKCKGDTKMLLYEKGNSRPKRPYKKAEMMMTFIFPDNRIRDFDNYIGGAKGFVDGIKLGKVIEDDSWQKLKVKYDAEIGPRANTIIEIREL